MRTQNILVLFLLVFVFAACEKEQIQLPETSTEANQILLTNDQETTPDSRTFSKDVVLDGEPVLLRALQWTSFLTARALKFSSLSRQEFSNGSTLDDVYDLNALLDPNGLYPNFSSEFRDVLFLYAAGRPDQEHEPNRPLTGSGNGMTVQAEVQAFLDIILEDNCIELYIPNGINNFVAEYNTTGHPLNEDDFNFGFKRLATPIWIEGEQINVVEIENFNDAYVQSHTNVIIARPDRFEPIGISATPGLDDTPDHPCSYSDYPVNFDLFLDQ